MIPLRNGAAVGSDEYLVRMPRMIQKFWTGHLVRSTLLHWLLPLSGVFLLGRRMEPAWALHIPAWLKPTLLWPLAFWVSVALGLGFGWVFLSVRWLPVPVRSSVPRPARARRRRPEHESHHRPGVGAWALSE
jgi:hypothetical protein